jgi:hypothetical protein
MSGFGKYDRSFPVTLRLAAGNKILYINAGTLSSTPDRMKAIAKAPTMLEKIPSPYGISVL